MKDKNYFNDGQPPILLVDDEEHNVSDLMKILDKTSSDLANFSLEIPRLYDYVSSPEDAIDTMLEVQEAGNRYRAIVTDFHMSPINGKDLLRVIFDRVVFALSLDEDEEHVSLSDLEKEVGEIRSFRKLMDYTAVHNEELVDFLENTFGDMGDYKGFLRYWNSAKHPIYKILFAGADKGDYQDSNEFSEEEFMFIKKQEGCEKDIVLQLIAEGVIPMKTITPLFDIKLNPRIPEAERCYREDE